MRKETLIGILVVILFLFPLMNTSSDYTPATTLNNSNLPLLIDTSPFAVSNDRSTGVGPALPVTLGGQISNVGQGTLYFDSSSSGVSSVTLTDGYTGSDLQAQIDSLAWTATDVLKNGELNDYHNEKFIVSSGSDNQLTVQVPDDWTIIKNVANDNPHPGHGVWELDSDPNGYSATRGAYIYAEWGSTFVHTANDEIYLSQMVSIPWREVYSATVTFQYNVRNSDPDYTDLADQVHLFFRLGDHVEKYHVFESSDPVNTWLTTTPITIPASSMTGLSNHVLLFDIGLATDLVGQTSSLDAFVYIDNIVIDLNVRPFPEQIDLKANGTLVWGSTTYSTYPYVPDDDNRDCYDDTTGGIDFDGYSNNGVLETGIYASSWDGGLFETGLQFPLDIPQGSIITSAYLEVEPASSSSPYVYGMRIHVADEDNTTAFVAGQHLETLYSWIETSIDWSFNSWITSPSNRYKSPDIGPLVQNVVSKSGWSDGNYICLMTSMMYADYYQRWSGIKGTYGSFFSSEERARLFVEYVIPEPDDAVLFYNYQKDITIDHLNVAGNLNNFPVLIDITDSELQNNVLSNGNDIIFTIDGNPVDHEIELFEQSTGHLVAWVKVPYISSTADTVITMHYGCENAPPAQGSKVWDEYETVNHLADDPSGIVYDSTANNYDGTSFGAMTSDDLVSGVAGNGINFDFDSVTTENSDMINIGQIYTDDWTSFTTSIWVYMDINRDCRVFSKSPSTTPAEHIITTRIASQTLNARIRTDSWGGNHAANTSFALDSWQYLVWMWDATSDMVVGYMNGVPVLSAAHSGTNLYDSDSVFVIANNNMASDATYNRFFDGILDEVRLTRSIRSAAWIQTEYNNQANPSGFYSSIGAQTKTPDTWSDASEPEIVFTTSSPGTVTMDVIVTMDVSGEAQTMDTDFNEGVSYFIESGSNVVNWTAKVMVSPPAGATAFGFGVEYPRAEWKATKVLNPLNQPKTVDQDWWYHGGTLTLNATSIDFWGVWTLKFISWNFLQDIQLNTPSFDVSDMARFTMTTPTVLGARVGLDLVQPDGSTWYSDYNQTTTDPTHRFPSFQYRKDITIPAAEIFGDAENFPVLIQFEDSDLFDTSKVRADASDILFADGDTILDHQIEYFDQSYSINTAYLSAWVKTNLTNGVDNTITMYYGSPIVDNLENPEGVWSNDYEAVWHLNEEDLVIGGDTHYDSTGNGHDGTRNGNIEVFDGAGWCQSFDGINDYISIDPYLTPQNDVLITGWFKLSSAHSASSANTKVIMEKYIDIDYDMVIALVGQDYAQGTVPNGTLVFKMESAPDSPMYKWTQTTSWSANQWYFIACYADEDNPSNNKIWVNMNWNTAAGQVGSTTQANMSFVEEVRLGGGNFESSYEGSGYFPGRLDEFRVSNSLRTDVWLRNEAYNINNLNTFLVRGTEQERSSPEHTLTKTIDSTAPAGEWTAIAYYNDTGASVTDKTGLFEKIFIVRHDTTLTLNKPTVTYKTVGDALLIEYELTDSDFAGNPAVTGATVTMNWTSPSSITLDEYGSGRYGKVLDTTDLGENKQWRIEVSSSHPYYNDASEYFNLDLYHPTILDASGPAVIPADFSFNTTLTFEDTFTGAPIIGATITYANGNPVTFEDNFDGTYDVSLPTTALSLGFHQYTFNATLSGAYLHIGQVDVDFTLRAHYTSVYVSGDLTTAHGDNTLVTIHLLDLDLGTGVTLSDVGTMTFSYSPFQTSDVVASYPATITSDDWGVDTYTVTLTITMSNSRISAPSPYVFTIEILAHETSITVTGVTTQPYGNQTPLSIILTDLDAGGTVPIGSVDTIELQYVQAPGSTIFGSYDGTLDTSAWPVGTHTVTVVITMSSTVYSAPISYQFDIAIRRMTSLLYHGPSALNFTIGADFTIDLHLNVSEAGPYFSDPITGRAPGEFSVAGYSEIIDTSQNADGIYTLTIGSGAFTGGLYEITVYFNSFDSRYANTFLVIQFYYREIISFLTSPNYPQVTTPFGLDVEITLEYADADFGTGIEGATIDSPTNNSLLYNIADETGGVYTVWIDVAGLPKGTHYIYLRADKSGYDAYTLKFRLVIRDAFTSVTPSVGALVIPIGNSPVFYVDYTDIDRLLPIENLTAPYTQVVSSWGNFSVEYLSGTQEYMITFHTSYADTIAQNQVYTFTFSKDNYQSEQFSITVTIRTHSTDFRIVSSIDPQTTVGVFSISVYYGDLDSAVGIKSALVDFWVENASGIVSSSYNYDAGDGFYIIQVPASQFGLGIQTFTVYADWTGAVSIYQDKSFVTTANVVGKDSALTLLISSEPTPYNEDMSYLFFFSDPIFGISNSSGDVFIYVNFQGETVNPSDISITSPQDGNYSIQFNSGIFSRTGLIYMNVYVNWSKGVAPYYTNRTDTISVRILPRDTLLSITPPSAQNYNENATFDITFEDVGSISLITGLTKQQLSLNISYTLSESLGVYTISFNTGQFGELGLHAIRIDVTWVGSPFYSNKTGRITYINVVARETYLEYLTPSPTQYGDQVVFNVTWTDTTAGSTDPITSATLVLRDGLLAVDPTEYSYIEIALGVYQVTLNTTYYTTPGDKVLRVHMSIAAFYISDAIVDRTLRVLQRLTIVAANPVAAVPYNTSITIILSYLDQFTSQPIANDSANGFPVSIVVNSPSGAIFTSTWSAATQEYTIVIAWDPSWDPVIWAPGTSHQFSIEMSYDYQAPFYGSDSVIGSFKIAIRQSTLDLDTEPETTPYMDDVTFIVFFSDDEAGGAGISGAQITITHSNSTVLIENTHYILTEGSPGYYTIVVHSTALASLGVHMLDVLASWTGEPYHEAATQDVNILIRQRETNVEITVPPSQTRYLDDVTFTFVYTDIDADTPITVITAANIHLYWQNGTEILSGFTITPDGSSFDVTISSTALSIIPVPQLPIVIEVDWNDSLVPYYKDDTTTVKVTITGRYMTADTSQIDRTPKGDVLTITITLTDLDNANPVVGAILLFNSPNGTGLIEGIHYDKVEIAGVWTISVYTDQLTGFGIFIFDVDIQWSPTKEPYYQNLNQFSLNGLVDYVRTSLQASVPTPSSVQFTEALDILITFRDLDHLGGIDGVDTSYIETQIVYLISRDTPSGLSVTALGGGMYNVHLDTTTLTIEGIYSLEISITWGVYASAVVIPQFSVTSINTALTAVPSLITLDWTDTAPVLVDFQDLLQGFNISSATVSWSIDGEFGEYLTEVSPAGRYRALIDTTDLGAGTHAIAITASKDQYTKSIAIVTLVVLTIPSDIVIVNPSAGTLEEGRGNTVDVAVKLNDTLANDWIPEVEVNRVFITFRSTEIDLTWNPFYDADGAWIGNISGSLTTIDPGPYDVRITAEFDNYQTGVDQFKLLISQTETQITVLDALENQVSAVYSEMVTFRLYFADKPTNTSIEIATIWWYEDDFNGLNLTFSHVGGGIWELNFNTTLGFFGTWGLTFRAIPTDPILGSATATLTLTIKKIETQVIVPLIAPEEIWGWSGYVRFFFNDTSFGNGVSGASVRYDYGDFRDLPAVDLGNGTYLVFINTTYLTSGERHRIIVDFQKTNYEERTSGVNFIVNLRPTVLNVLSEEYNQINEDSTQLQIPMGDSFYVTFYYNDTNPVGGFTGGISSATITDNTLFAGTSFGGQRNFTLENMGDGYYRFFFDTMDSSLFDYFDGVPQTGERYFFTVSLEFANRVSQDVSITIEIIEVPTEYILELPAHLELVHGDTLEFRFYVNDTWHNEPVLGASITADFNPAVVVYGNGTDGDGWYYLLLRAEGVDTSGFIEVTITLDYHESHTFTISASSAANDTDRLIGQVTRIGLPISLLIISLLGLYVRVWSVPKRIRQINGQLKTLRKGKIPKPIGDVKSRKQLTAELFNDTFEKLKITRTAAQMPEDAIPIEVPEMGELLMQLAILTNLNQEELDDFQADINKMKISEQAAFVKEVIMQEAIRAARRERKTVEEIIAAVEQEAHRRLGGEEGEVVEPVDVVDTGPIETVFLEEEKVEPRPKEEVTPEEEKFEEVTETTSEKMSMYEIEELRRDLERRGVPPHEIDTIIEQAKELPRELVDELVKSLEGKKD